MFGDARMAGSFFTGIPNGLVGNGSVLIALTHAAGKKIVYNSPTLARQAAVIIGQKRDLGHPSRFSFGFGWKGLECLRENRPS